MDYIEHNDLLDMLDYMKFIAFSSTASVDYNVIRDIRKVMFSRKSNCYQKVSTKSKASKSKYYTRSSSSRRR